MLERGYRADLCGTGPDRRSQGVAASRPIGKGATTRTARGDAPSKSERRPDGPSALGRMPREALKPRFAMPNQDANLHVGTPPDRLKAYVCATVFVQRAHLGFFKSFRAPVPSTIRRAQPSGSCSLGSQSPLREPPPTHCVDARKPIHHRHKGDPR
jgi:hypothetical protein